MGLRVPAPLASVINQDPLASGRIKGTTPTLSDTQDLFTSLCILKLHSQILYIMAPKKEEEDAVATPEPMEKGFATLTSITYAPLCSVILILC